MQAEFHQSYPMEPGSKLTVVELSGWDQTTLDVSATRYAETQPLLDALKVDIAVASGGAVIRALPPWSAAEIATSNGAVRVQGH